MPLIYSNLFSNGIIGQRFLNDPSDKTALTLMIIGVVLVVICSYLLGSINFAIIVSGKRFKEDIRSHGSKNAGMTNMLRTYGKRAAGLTLAGDALKGILSCILGYIILGPLGARIAGLFCMLGHVFPIFYGFKGGKGVVTAFATILVCDTPVFLVLILIFIIIVAFTKYLSLGSIMCMALYPVLLDRMVKLLQGRIIAFPELLISILLAMVVIIKHWENIKRLMNGQENKFSFKKSPKSTKNTIEDTKDDNE